jgi:hypothetical protein
MSDALLLRECDLRDQLRARAASSTSPSHEVVGPPSAPRAAIAEGYTGRTCAGTGGSGIRCTADQLRSSWELAPTAPSPTATVEAEQQQARPLSPHRRLPPDAPAGDVYTPLRPDGYERIEGIEGYSGHRPRQPRHDSLGTGMWLAPPRTVPASADEPSRLQVLSHGRGVIID